MDAPAKTLNNPTVSLLQKPEAPPLPVAPAPRVTHLLPYTQALCSATWRITSLDDAAPVSEVLVAYDDGAHLTWTIKRPHADDTAEIVPDDEVVIVSNTSVATIPYGEDCDLR